MVQTKEIEATQLKAENLTWSQVCELLRLISQWTPWTSWKTRSAVVCCCDETSTLTFSAGLSIAASADKIAGVYRITPAFRDEVRRKTRRALKGSEVEVILDNLLNEFTKARQPFEKTGRTYERPAQGSACWEVRWVTRQEGRRKLGYVEVSHKVANG